MNIDGQGGGGGDHGIIDLYLENYSESRRFDDEQMIVYPPKLSITSRSRDLQLEQLPVAATADLSCHVN